MTQIYTITLKNTNYCGYLGKQFPILQVIFFILDEPFDMIRNSQFNQSMKFLGMQKVVEIQ